MAATDYPFNEAQECTMTGRYNPFLYLLAILLWPAAPASANQEQLPSPFEASYEATYNGFEVTATRSLRETDSGWEFRFVADSWLASLQEISRFQWDDAGQFIPRQYTYQRKVMGRKHREQQDFDWRAGRATYSSDKQSASVKFSGQTLDKLGYQLQLQRDLINDVSPLRYQIVDGRRLKSYEFAVLDEETLNTSAGTINTVRVERVRDDDDRATVLWLAKDWDYLLVRMQQYEDGELEFEINLSSAKIDGQSLTGIGQNNLKGNGTDLSNFSDSGRQINSID